MGKLSNFQATIIGVLTTLFAIGTAMAALFLFGGASSRNIAPVAISTLTPAPPSATLPPTPTNPPLTATPTTSPTPAPIDYAPLLQRFEETIDAAFNQFATAFDVGVAFIDLQTGQQVAINGDITYYSLSTFKAPLAAYYLKLVEQGTIPRDPTDDVFIEPMLERSDNPSTTCIVRRVGGLEGFNDYLVTDLNMVRDRNYIIAWDTWACEEDGTPWYPASDLRYIDGDPSVGLEAVGGLRPCPSPQVRCDKIFTPLELAIFYQRMADGALLNPENTEQWFTWMQKEPDNSAFFDGLPDGEASIEVFTKTGFRAEDSFYDRHFYHEGGIVQTQHGSFVLVIFTQGNPDWPGTWLHADLTRDAYEEFVQAYTNQ